jgi:hypothetical protein
MARLQRHNPRARRPVKQVLEAVTLPTGSPPEAALRSWAAYLTPLLRDIGFRLNRVAPKDGSETFTAPMRLGTYTVATRPAAATWPGAIIYVSDAAAGARFQGSDGTAWVNLG